MGGCNERWDEPGTMSRGGNEETCPCETCGQETRMLATKRCDACYEFETRLDRYLIRGGAKARSVVVVSLVAFGLPVAEMNQVRKIWGFK